MWNRIEPLLPADPVRGRRWADHRRTLEAVAWKYRTSSPWPGPARGARPFQTSHKRPARCPGPGSLQHPSPNGQRDRTLSFQSPGKRCQGDRLRSAGAAVGPRG
ncbi:transposase [Streptomyces sp. Ag109_O5-1]|uniref:transposase n=1 Tax=Streptomyces sp. Ag109_O5-1 TaxID=1938851 RepID=UPI0021A561B6|nr:transposase [Streptomyces sp. Ag109_O5-1]